MKNGMRVLIAGCGYLGGALAGRLVTKGHSVVAIRRSVGLSQQGVTWIAADLVDGSLPQEIGNVDAMVYAVAADEYSDTAYERAYVIGVRNLISWMTRTSSHSLPFVFVSSTGVYGQDDGTWVDESSDTVPKAFNGSRLLEGEQLVLGACSRGIVVRFGGIYGPGRTRMIERVWSGEGEQSSDSGFINLIHRDDCAAVIEHLVDLSPLENMFIGVYCQPVDRAELNAWWRD